MLDRARRTIFTLAIVMAAFSSCTKSNDDRHSQEVADRIRTEFSHAWNGYVRYAWGHDALRPLSNTPHDWYGEPLLMTPVDALDTMLLMKLDAEAEKTRQLVDTQLSFDRDIYVKNFEVTIRLLGGLLSSYQLTGDERLFDLSKDLGRRLLPVFNSPTGLPYVFVNLRTGAVRDPITNPAETGTLLLEFGTLSKLTGDPVFYDKAKRALVETYKRRSSIGLVGEAINAETGEWTNPDSHVSGGIDSYYEYLWKCWRLFGDKDCLEMWKSSVPAVHKYLADEVNGELWYGHANMNSGTRSATTYGALDAFFPGLLALSGDVARARRLQNSSFKMWNLYGIEPEILDYKTMHVVSPTYHLRPEIVESTYYLYHFTRDPEYHRAGEKMFDDLVKYCRTESAYAGLDDVVAKKQRDEMESFVFAETFKYFYLLFAAPNAIDFDNVTFNTEAHPLRAPRQTLNKAAHASVLRSPMSKIIALVVAGMFATGAVFAGEHGDCTRQAGNNMKPACSVSLANLNLTSDQQTKMDAVMAEHHKAGCSEASEAAYMKQAEGILTKEQFAKFKAECKEHHDKAKTAT